MYYSSDMASPFNVAKFAAMLRAKRGGRGLRELAEEIQGVSASTLSRIEQGNVPDVETFARLIKWLGVSADDFVTGHQPGSNAAPGPELIEANLRASRTLPPEAIEALSQMIRFAFDAASARKRK